MRKDLNLILNVLYSQNASIYLISVGSFYKNKRKIPLKTHSGQLVSHFSTRKSEVRKLSKHNWFSWTTLTKKISNIDADKKVYSSIFYRYMNYWNYEKILHVWGLVKKKILRLHIQTYKVYENCTHTRYLLNYAHASLITETKKKIMHMVRHLDKTINKSPSHLGTKNIQVYQVTEID